MFSLGFFKQERLEMYKLVLCLVLLVSNVAFAGTSPRSALELPLAKKAVFLDLVSNDQSVIAVGERGIILKSDDKGLTWAQVKSPVDVTLTGIAFSSKKIGWIVGHESTILKTIDGGNSWEISRYQPEDERFYMSVNFMTADKGYVLGTDGELWSTEDGGNSWDLTVLSVEEWYQNHLFAIEKVANTSLVVGERGGIFKKSIEEKDWQTVSSPYEGSFFGVNKVGEDFLVFGMSGNLYRLNAHTLEWTKINTNTDQFLLESASIDATGGVLVVGRGGIILVVNENGQLTKTIQNKSRADYTAVTIQDKTVYLSSMTGGITQMSLSDLIEK